MKRAVIFFITVILLFSVTGCNKQEQPKPALEQEPVTTIGIIQMSDYPEQEKIKNGVLDGLRGEGYFERDTVVLEVKSAQNSTETLNTICSSFRENNVSAIVAITEPVARAAVVSFQEKGIPLVFAGVQNPAADGLLKDIEQVQGGITCVYEQYPLEQHIAMARDFLPDATRMGVLVNEVEPGAYPTDLDTLAQKYGFSLIKEPIINGSDLTAQLNSLAERVDCVQLLSDTLTCASIDTILTVFSQHNKAVLGVDETQIKAGCILGEVTDYYALGKQAGKLAAEALKNGKVGKPISISEFKPLVNEQAMEQIQTELPTQYDDTVTKAEPES